MNATFEEPMNTRHENVGFSAGSVRIQFIILAVSWWIGLPLSLTAESLPLLAVLWIPAIIVTTVFWCILLYRHWSLLQGHGARTTPGKAVGFCFIPFFGFYWWFVAFVGLAADNNRYLSSLGITTVRMSYGLAVSLCIVSVLNYTISWLFFSVEAMLTIAYMVMGFILVLQQRNCVLAILFHRKGAASIGTPATHVGHLGDTEFSSSAT